MTNPSDTKEPDIILASESPRRKYLLEQAGLSFTVVPSRFDEDSVPVSAPTSYVTRLAEEKARQVGRKYSDSWVIGADTVVAINGNILGKPASRSEAKRMLEQLSGATHQVYTGFCVICEAKARLCSKCIKTDVEFKKLSPQEIEWYIRTDEPFDKAGAYAIQGLGTFLVRRINGSYTNVVGLPVCEVIEYLIQEGVVRLTPDKPEGNVNVF